MRLFIAEKPSLGRAIAEYLPSKGKPVGTPATHIVCGNDVVTWCFGHLLEVQEPPECKSWNMAALPIDTHLWPQAPRKDAANQVKVIRGLLAECSEVVHAGDPDREGQLLVDELLDYLGNRKPCKRIWLAALDEKSVVTALNSLKNNQDYVNLSASAKARQDGDLLVGINLSRAYTLAAEKTGYNGVLSIGRVQTPTLALIVNRCMAVENFQPKDFFTVNADLRFQAGAFVATWLPGNEIPTDEAGRVLDRGIAETIKGKVEGQTAKVEKFTSAEKQEEPPLPFALSALQAAANKQYGLSAQDVLNTAQELYEAKLTTYPRTDCSYLPENQHEDVSRVLAGLPDDYQALVEAADPARKSSAWNDKKITAHHAIIPTGTKPGQLTARQAQVYDLIVRAYLAQFFPPFIYRQISIIVDVAGETFRANGKTPIQPGWTVINGRNLDEDEKEDEGIKQSLPDLVKGALGDCIRADVVAKKTTPPAYFTEGTLIKAMTNIHQWVDDPELKIRLKETAGIGTEATRAGIIETLKKRRFIVERGKTLRDTEAGRKLILALPERVKSPGLTGLFEQLLSAIAEGTITPAQFLAKQKEFVAKYVDHARNNRIEVGSGSSDQKTGKVEGKPQNCPTCKSGQLRRIKGKNGHFWGCSRYSEGCRATFPDVAGKPKLSTAAG
ncbi:DNA topoisomerase III (plasmid) [Methylocaldum gracile subsp. desertum]|uniref:DNA topoisomerase III n=1 Tax=Methylocaldum sp. GT1BW TaxID=3438964 RepID=UPI003DA13C1F